MNSVDILTQHLRMLSGGLFGSEVMSVVEVDAGDELDLLQVWKVGSRSCELDEVGDRRRSGYPRLDCVGEEGRKGGKRREWEASEVDDEIDRLRHHPRSGHGPIGEAASNTSSTGFLTNTHAVVLANLASFFSKLSCRAVPGGASSEWRRLWGI
jgi:hypothetical protein